MDWLWFGETGYRDVFITTLVAQGTLGAAAMALALAVLLINTRIALRALSVRTLELTTQEGPIRGHGRSPTRSANRHGGRRSDCADLRRVRCEQWQEWLLFSHAQPFGEVDPVLGRDIGFYLFRLPFMEILHGFLFALVALSGAVAASTYAIAGGD